MAQFNIDSCVLTVKSSRLNIDACAVEFVKKTKKSRECTTCDSYYQLQRLFSQNYKKWNMDQVNQLYDQFNELYDQGDHLINQGNQFINQAKQLINQAKQLDELINQAYQLSLINQANQLISQAKQNEAQANLFYEQADQLLDLADHLRSLPGLNGDQNQ